MEIAPQLMPLDYEGGKVDYPLSDGRKITVPKDRAANVLWRKQLLQKARDDRDVQNQLKILCAASFYFWINAFGWTFLQLQIDDGGRMRAIIGGKGSHIPFITWPVQDVGAEKLLRGIKHGGDLAIDKSRDMGASWLVLSVFHWYWQFQADVTFLEISRKLSLVYNDEDQDSLFWKHKYLLQRQPGFLRPRWKMTGGDAPKLINLDNRSVILGATTTSEVGHGGRKTAVLFDEASRIRQLKTAWEGASSMTGCRVANSTPRGYTFFTQLVNSPKVVTVALDWYNHPHKGKGREVFKDGDGQMRVTSPWYRQQQARAVSAREIAENLDRDHAGAGFVFFDMQVLAFQENAYAANMPATWTGELVYRGDGTIYDSMEHGLINREVHRLAFKPDRRGRWRIWADLIQGRPDQGRTYVFGIDVSGGTGASNSVISVFDPAAAWKVAEFASATTSPDELAEIACAAGWWFGGARSCAFIAWEANGYGSIFGKRLLRLRYPWYLRAPREKFDELSRRTKWPGWWSNPQNKIDLLEDYGGAMKSNRFRNPSMEALQEARTYIFYENGQVGPAELQDEKGDARKTHGDRVIADAVAWHAGQKAPRVRPVARTAPAGSVMERKIRAEEAEKRRRRTGVLG